MLKGARRARLRWQYSHIENDPAALLIEKWLIVAFFRVSYLSLISYRRGAPLGSAERPGAFLAYLPCRMLPFAGLSPPSSAIWFIVSKGGGDRWTVMVVVLQLR